MDALKITSALTRGFISNLISRLIEKNTGYSVKINLKELDTIVDENGKVHASLNIDAHMDKESYEKVLQSIKL